MNGQNKNKELSPVEVFKFSAKLWRKQPKKLVVILTALIVAALLEASLPSSLSYLLTVIKTSTDASKILGALGIFLGNYFAFVILFNIAYLIYNVFETKTFNTLLDDVFTHVQHLSEHFFVNTFTGSIITKIKRGRDKIETFEDQILLRLLPTAVILLGSTFFLAFRFPMLALLLAVYLVAIVIVSIVMVLRVAGPAQADYANAEDGFGAHLADTVAGINTTKTYAQEDLEASRFYQVTRKLRAKNLRAYHKGNAASFTQQLLLGGMLALLLSGGTWYFLNGRATIEDMAYLALAYTIIQSYIREVGENIKNLLTASYDLHAVIGLLRETPQVKDLPNAKKLTVNEGTITFDKVSFTYPGKNSAAFRGLSVSIKGGERVALVGHSGSGKTTFVRLVQRLYDVQKGGIYIDGQNVQQVTQASLRSNIALVPQDPILFHRSLEDNIAYAKPRASLKEIRTAAKKAHIDNFIMSLPQQYETLVGERGVKLSGGERQRVAIARAILADRPIFILDEATSSLDSVSEKAIQDALHILTHGRTSIMIAHRLSTIQEADRILVFEEGKIVEEGTHEDLVKKDKGIYANFFRMQSGGYIKDKQ